VPTECQKLFTQSYSKGPIRNESSSPPLLELQIHNNWSFSLPEFLYIWHSSVIIVTKLKADDTRNYGSSPNRDKKLVSSPRTMTSALGPIPHPIQEVARALSSEVKWPGHDVDQGKI
jgi:hypothetical protein